MRHSAYMSKHIQSLKTIDTGNGESICIGKNNHLVKFQTNPQNKSKQTLE